MVAHSPIPMFDRMDHPSVPTTFPWRKAARSVLEGHPPPCDAGGRRGPRSRFRFPLSIQAREAEVGSPSKSVTAFPSIIAMPLIGEAVVQTHPAKTAKPTTTQPAEPVVVGLDGGYVRSRHRQEERHFEVVAGKVIDAHGVQSRFAFARNSPAIASDAFKQALATAGVQADTPAIVLCDGDAGLWRLQREALPHATVVLDWWHAAVRFEHALQTARGLGTGTADKRLTNEAVRGLERAKWALVARALARMPAQARGPVSVDAAQACLRHGRHRASRAARQ